MGLRIQTNVSAMGTSRRLTTNSGERARTLQRLSSGERIVRSGDDAAGMSISEKLKAGIRSMQMAFRNTQDSISVVQTAEGGAVEAQNILHRLRELSVQSASDTVGDHERQFLDNEFQHLKKEITRVANTTNYNGTALLNGTSSALDFQVGIENDSLQDRITFQAGDANMTAVALGIQTAAIHSKEGAQKNLGNLESAVNRISNFRSQLGGIQANLREHSSVLEIYRQNLSHGNSRIRDADYAEWTAESTKQAILQDVNTSMHAQANTIGQSAVRLLEKA